MDYRADDWAYQHLPDERIKRLRECPDYNQLVETLIQEINPLCAEFMIDVGRYEPVDGALRPLIYVTFDCGLVDWFFNGLCGYRAQYYQSPEDGLKANSFLFAKAEQKLLQIAEENGFREKPLDYADAPRMDYDTVLTCLRLNSAKIWGDESEGELSTIVRTDQDFKPQILAPRWIRNAQTGIQKARKGIKAPKFVKLKFHGAFMKCGVEKIPLNKMCRSEDIYLYGFS